MIPFYDKHGFAYIQRTIDVNVSHLYDLFQPYLNLLEHPTILDVGFGSGRDIRYFESQGHEVIGVDTSPLMCKHSRETTNADIYQCDLFKFSKKVDAIWCCACLVHVPDFKAALEHFKTITRGPILVSVKIGEASMTVTEGERTFYILSPDDVHGALIDTGFIVHEWESNRSSIDPNDTWLTVVITPE